MWEDFEVDVDDWELSSTSTRLGWISIVRKIVILWAVVVTYLVEQMILTPEVCSSNPVIGKIYIHYQLCCNDKDKGFTQFLLKIRSF